MEHYSPDMKLPELLQYLELCSRSLHDAGGIYSGCGFLPLFLLLYPKNEKKKQGHDLD